MDVARIFKINKKLFHLIIFGCLFFANSANAKSDSPIVIEFFGKNNCSSDAVIQESLQKIAQTQNNVHIINCRTRNDGAKEAKTFTMQFCTNRRKLYDKKFGSFTFKYPAFIIVNGRWDASYQDLNPAINLGRSDNVKDISVEVHDNVIDISIPEIKSDKGYGEILLYTYVPTIDEKAIFVDSDVSFTDKMQERINKNMSVPFVTKARTSPFYFRPVLATEKIGKWNGGKLDFTFSLNNITSLSGASYSNLSYIVVLYEGDDIGAVLAVGEYMSLKEINNTLPHSEPTEIKYITPDPRDLVQ